MPAKDREVDSQRGVARTVSVINEGDNLHRIIYH